MKKAGLKTKKTRASVEDYLAGITDPVRAQDARSLTELMARVTRAKPKMWGPGIVGFGDCHYRYESGREGDWFVTGFSSRKQNLTLYLMNGFGEYGPLRARLGKHATGKACLYVKRLADIDLAVLEEMIRQSVTTMATRG